MSEATVKAEDLPYRPCVGVMILNREGLVWAGRRIPDGNSEYDGSPQLWQMPQGGIDKGEDPADTALRELFEETSIRSVELIAEAPDWIYYDLPDDVLGTALKGKYRGQRQRWFAFRFTGDESEIDVVEPGDGSMPAEFDTWRWEELDKLPDLIVPFKREAYQQIVAAFRDIPTKLRRA